MDFKLGKDLFSCKTMVAYTIIHMMIINIERKLTKHLILLLNIHYCSIRRI